MHRTHENQSGNGVMNCSNVYRKMTFDTLLALQALLMKWRLGLTSNELNF